MLHTFTETQVKNAIVKHLNRNYDFIAEVGRYINVEDIESVENWWIGLRVRFVPGVYKYRYRMVSKVRVCEKLSPNKQEVTFTLMGRSVSEVLHLATYFYKWDESQVEHIWTVSLGFESSSSARSMQFWLFKQQKAAHSIVRRKHRTTQEYELKVWGMDGDLLTRLLAGGTGQPLSTVELMDVNKDWHEICRQQISNLGVLNKSEYKPQGWQTEYKLTNQPTNMSPIKVIKPNGAYRFMQNDVMLVAVYTKEEVIYIAKKFLGDGYSVYFEDPASGAISQAFLNGDKLKYKLVSETA